MISSLVGVWELVSDSEKGLWIFTDTHFSFTCNRQDRRLGHAGTYRTEGNHLHLSRFVSTPPNSVTQVTMEFQHDGDLLTTTMLTEGNLLPVGQSDTFRKISG